MASILIIYSTVDGHTLEICQRLGSIVESNGHDATLYELKPEDAPDPGLHDGVIIGASIRYGKHRPEVSRFIEDQRQILESRPGAFFSVNAVARKPEKRTPETNPYVRKFLSGITWRPDIVEIFGGKIDYPRYSFWEKTIIRLIMWITNGPTDPTTIVDFTDWDQVEAFGHRVSALQLSRGAVS